MIEVNQCNFFTWLMKLYKDKTVLDFFKKDKSTKCLLLVHIVPDSSKNELIGTYGEPPRLKVKIKAAPEDGKANEMLIHFLAEILKVKKGQIQIMRGHTQKRKDLLIEADFEELQDLIAECLNNCRPK
jgi:uncharacterized protein (TIGR00251 family)